jgi:hypothetical protein
MKFLQQNHIIFYYLLCRYFSDIIIVGCAVNFVMEGDMYYGEKGFDS